MIWLASRLEVINHTTPDRIFIESEPTCDIIVHNL